LGADDAAGDGLTDAERVADGENKVADFEGFTGLQGDAGEELVVGDTQEGEVGGFVGEGELRIKFAAIIKDDGDFCGIAYDMGVGDDETCGVNDCAGAKRVFGLAAEALAEGILAAEEGGVEKRVIGEGVVGAFDDFAGVDVDDGGRDLLDQRGEGELDLLLALRDLRFILRHCGHAHQGWYEDKYSDNCLDHILEFNGYDAKDNRRN